jgi:tRNA(Arg) A34 adenosine deaminase TadA
MILYTEVRVGPFSPGDDLRDWKRGGRLAIMKERKQDDSKPRWTMDDHSYLRRAFELAEKRSSGGGGGPFGAVVVANDRIVGEGWNQVVQTADPTAHAEIMAIRHAARALGTHVLRNCTLYCSCEPCPMCLSAIYCARIPRVVFSAGEEDAQAVGFDDSVISRELKLDWSERSVEHLQIRREEGRRVLEAWLQDPDRIEY